MSLTGRIRSGPIICTSTARPPAATPPSPPPLPPPTLPLRILHPKTCHYQHDLLLITLVTVSFRDRWSCGRTLRAVGSGTPKRLCWRLGGRACVVLCCGPSLRLQVAFRVAYPEYSGMLKVLELRTATVYDIFTTMAWGA